MVDDPVAPDKPLLTKWRRVLEVGKRIASCELPVVAVPLGQREVGPVVIGPPREPFKVHDAPIRERPERHVRERTVCAGRRVVGHVAVDSDLFAPPSGVIEIHLERSNGP